MEISMSKRLLMVPQYSNYNRGGKFDLSCDSGWQMCINRVRELFKLVPDLHVDIIGPYNVDSYYSFNQLISQPQDINADLFQEHGDRLSYLQLYHEPNALQLRYEFDFENLSFCLKLDRMKPKRPQYDTVYLNDPVMLRHYRAFFSMHRELKYRPRFVVHSHFIDNPSAPKFPEEASLWMSQCEGARRADWNFWQSHSSMETFFDEMAKEYTSNVVSDARVKSCSYDDGYSIDEINIPVNHANVNPSLYDAINRAKQLNKVIVFVPNRVGRDGVSSDYTRCGKFMFEVLPKMASLRLQKDYIVICGNPSQKISNEQLLEECGQHGYENVLPASPNRDEYKFIAKSADITICLYGGPNADTYGGTAMRECVELGSAPFMADCNEYRRLGQQVNWPYMTQEDLTLAHSDLASMISEVQNNPEFVKARTRSLQDVVRDQCSFEKTTKKVLKYIF